MQCQYCTGAYQRICPICYGRLRSRHFHRQGRRTSGRCGPACRTQVLSWYYGGERHDEPLCTDIRQTERSFRDEQWERRIRRNTQREVRPYGSSRHRRQSRRIKDKRSVIRIRHTGKQPPVRPAASMHKSTTNRRHMLVCTEEDGGEEARLFTQVSRQEGTEEGNTEATQGTGTVDDERVVSL